MASGGGGERYSALPFYDETVIGPQVLVPAIPTHVPCSSHNHPHNSCFPPDVFMLFVYGLHLCLPCLPRVRAPFSFSPSLSLPSMM